MQKNIFQVSTTEYNFYIINSSYFISGFGQETE